MIQWTHPQWLVVGLTLTVLVGFMWARYERRRRWALAQFAGGLARTLAHAEPDRQRRVRWGLRVAALALLAVAAAGPRWGEEVVRVSTQGSDLVFLFDCSRSMDARDVPPSRLIESKREALALLDDLEGDRVAVVAFAGDAAALTPLTLDLSAVRLLVESLDTDAISTPGTDVGKGLTTALRVLPEGGDAGEQAIVVFTDGEDLEGQLAAGAALAQRRGVKVFPVGVGTAAGETIPVLDDNGRQVGVKLDESGQPVVSRVDGPALADLAHRTGGRAFAAQHPGGQLAALRAAVANVGRGARAGRLGSRPMERFLGFALAAWLCLVVSWLLPERRALRGEKMAAGPGAAAAVLLVAGLALAAGPARAAHPLVDGNARFDAGDVNGAIRVYQAALKQHPDDPALWNNLGVAFYRANRFDDAEQAFAHVRSADDRTQGLADYGKGDALYRQGKYREALGAFRDALERMPGDHDARHNYEATLRKLVAPPKPPDQPQQNPPPSPKNPQSGKGGGGGGGGGQPPPNPPPAGGGSAPQPPPQSTPDQGHMTREQAERLLDALDQGERQARAAQRRRAGGEERHGKDW